MNKEKTIDEYTKDIWGNDIKKFIINSHAEVYIHRLEKENQQLKKQKDDVVEYIKEIKKHREEGLTITEYKTKWRSMFDYLESDEIIDNLLRMLGEIDGL